MGRRIPRVLYLPDRPTGQFRTIAHGNYGQFLPPYAADVECVAAHGTPVMDRNPRSPNPEISDTIGPSGRVKSRQHRGRIKSGLVDAEPQPLDGAGARPACGAE